MSGSATDAAPQFGGFSSYGQDPESRRSWLLATVTSTAIYAGIALAVGRASDRPTYWVQVFAAPKLR